MGIFDFFKKKSVSFDLEKLLQLNDNTTTIIELDTRLNELSNYGENLNKLTTQERVFLFVENLEREVNNGGFNQFYWNSSGDYAHETLDGLKAIGANNMSDIMFKAHSVWPDQVIPKDRKERQIVQERIEYFANEVWEQCDKEFYEYSDDIESLLIMYVKKYRQDFQQ